MDEKVIVVNSGKTYIFVIMGISLLFKLVH